jgi:competence protein ComEC
MLFCAFGLCWLLLWRTRLRLAGVVMIAAGLASYAFIRLPDVYISQDVKQVALRQKDGSYAMLRGSPRGFIVRQWAEGAGAEQFARKAEMACDPEGCAAPFGDGFVALPEYSMALAEDCRFASLVITPSYVDQPCAAEVIDRNRLKREGHVWGWYDEASGGWRFTSTRAVQGDRIWSR